MNHGQGYGPFQREPEIPSLRQLFNEKRNPVFLPQLLKEKGGTDFEALHARCLAPIAGGEDQRIRFVPLYYASVPG